MFSQTDRNSYQNLRSSGRRGVGPAISSMSPLVFLVLGPSGVGKTTVIGEVISRCSGLLQPPQITTRSPRSCELQGKDRTFVSIEEFQRKISAGSFIEHTSFCGNYYGTEVSALEVAKSEKVDLMLDLDLVGLEHLRGKSIPNMVSVGLVPPSYSELAIRLSQRNTESQTELSIRLGNAEKIIDYLRHPGNVDHVIENSQLEQTVSLLARIVRHYRTVRDGTIEYSIQVQTEDCG